MHNTSIFALLGCMGERHLLVAVLIDISLLFRGVIGLSQAIMSENVSLCSLEVRL